MLICTNFFGTNEIKCLWNKVVKTGSSRNGLTRRRHDMGNLPGDETSCESSTPLTYSTLNVLVPDGQRVLRKTPLKFYT